MIPQQIEKIHTSTLVKKNNRQWRTGSVKLTMDENFLKFSNPTHSPQTQSSRPSNEDTVIFIYIYMFHDILRHFRRICNFAKWGRLQLATLSPFVGVCPEKCLHLVVYTHSRVRVCVCVFVTVRFISISTPNQLHVRV